VRPNPGGEKRKGEAKIGGGITHKERLSLCRKESYKI